MANQHLNTDRLLAIHGGDLGDLEALEHLVSCPECRRAFDDTRWFLLLRRLPQILDSGPHPDRDELVAYHTYAMPPARMAEVESHLESCRHCLTRVGRARAAERGTHYRSPSPDLLRRVQRGFRSPKPLRRLGTLVVRRLGEGLGLEFVPLRLAGERAAGRRSRNAAGHPGSARGRLRRMMDRASRSLRRSDEALSRGFDECEEQAQVRDQIANLEDLTSAWLGTVPSGESDAREPVHIPAAGLELTLLPGPEDERSSLAVRVVRRDSKEPAAGVGLRVTGGEGDIASAVTDADGRANLPLGPEARELIVDLEPPLALVLCVLD